MKAASRNRFSRHAVRRRVDQERTLIERYHARGDLCAREKLIQRFLPLARALAARSSGSHSHEDVFQVASVALIKGIDRYDPSRGTALSSYLVPTILGEIKRHFRDVHWPMRVPRDMHDRMMAARTADESLWQRLGHPPTPIELAEELGISTEAALELHEAASTLIVRSLDEPLESDDASGEKLGGAVGAVDERLEAVEERSVLAAGLRALPDRERLILKLRFEDELRQADIAERLGISQMHVSRLIRRALDRLKAVAEEDRGEAS